MNPRAAAKTAFVAAPFVVGVLGACSPGLSFETGASSSATNATTSGTGAGGPDDTGSGAGSGSGGDGAGTPASSGSSSDGGASSSTAGPGTTVSVVSTGTGADCVEAIDCRDSNPCTIDTCSPEGTCVSVGVDPGEAGNAGEGSCPTGVCQADATCGLQVYFHTFGDPSSQWGRRTLSEQWGVGANVPRYDEVAEVVPLPAIDKLLVFNHDEDGTLMLHAYDPTLGWIAPFVAAEKLPGLPDDIRCGYAYQSLASSTDMELLLDGPGPASVQQAYIYTAHADGTATPNAGNPFPVDRTDEPGDPPPNEVLCRWAFSRQTGYLGDPSWVVAYEGTGPNVYSYDGGDAHWVDYGLDVNSPIWDAQGDGPAAQSVVAGWLEGDTIYLVAP